MFVSLLFFSGTPQAGTAIQLISMSVQHMKIVASKRIEPFKSESATDLAYSI